MLHRTIVSAGISLALTTSFIAPSLAATTDEETPTVDAILEEQASFNAVGMCEDKKGTFRGKCIGDVIKRLKMMRDELKDALEKERAEWYAAHSHLGVSAEYTKALQAYTTETSKKRQLFNEQQRTLEKLFFGKQKEAIIKANQSSSTSSRGFSRPVTKDDLTSAEEKCSKQKDTTAKRICMRQQLRLQDPNARTKGAGLRTGPVR